MLWVLQGANKFISALSSAVEIEGTARSSGSLKDNSEMMLYRSHDHIMAMSKAGKPDCYFTLCHTTNFI